MRKLITCVLIVALSTASFLIHPLVYPPKKFPIQTFDVYCGTLQGRGVAILGVDGEEYAQPVYCGVEMPV